MKILISQINPIVGDLKYNSELIIKSIDQGEKLAADLVLFPELALTGYPPQDLLWKQEFIQAVEAKLEQIAATVKEITVIIGLPRACPKAPHKLFNSAAIIERGKIIGYVDKVLLPTYDVFNEQRYFNSGNSSHVWTIKGKKIAILICEDIWQHSSPEIFSNYHRDPVLELKTSSPDVVLNLSASPYFSQKPLHRQAVCLKVAKTLHCPVILCNQIGANDSLIFDGNSLYVGPKGLIKCAAAFKEEHLLIDLEKQEVSIKKEESVEKELYEALVLGVRDYFLKQGLKTACLGLSGGIDSALVATIASEALGPQNVTALFMPSRFSSFQSARDAKLLAANLKMPFKIIEIEEAFHSLSLFLTSQLDQPLLEVTTENLQARIRALLLMAFSNNAGALLLATGNKSELSMGYATLYGDMCGALSVIGDLTKSQVVAIAKWINRAKEIIPWYTIERPPSAELKENQKDSDVLPDYKLLDAILTFYIEKNCSAQTIANMLGMSQVEVEQIILRIHQNEYKRRQAPPALKVSAKAFTIGRHFPIVQRWSY